MRVRRGCGFAGSLKRAECAAVGVVWEQQADERQNARRSAATQTENEKSKRGGGDNRADGDREAGMAQINPRFFFFFCLAAELNRDKVQFTPGIGFV